MNQPHNISIDTTKGCFANLIGIVKGIDVGATGCQQSETGPLLIPVDQKYCSNLVL